MVQIWRLNSTENSTYTKVAAYELNEDNGVIVSENVNEYLVNPPISVEAEDIIGILQPSSRSIKFKVYYQECNGPNNIITHYREYEPTTVENPATLTINDYPLIAVNVSKPDNDNDASPLSNNSREDEMLNKQMKLDKLLSSIENIAAVSTSTIEPFSTAIIPLLSKPTTVPSNQLLMNIFSSSAMQVTSTLIIKPTKLFSSAITQSQEMVSIRVMHETLLITLISIGATIFLGVLLTIVILVIFICAKQLRRKKFTFTINSCSAIGLFAVKELDENENEKRESMLYNPLYHYAVYPPLNTPLPTLPSEYLKPVSTLERQENEQEPLYEEIPCKYVHHMRRV